MSVIRVILELHTFRLWVWCFIAGLMLSVWEFWAELLTFIRRINLSKKSIILVFFPFYFFHFVLSLLTPYYLTCILYALFACDIRKINVSYRRELCNFLSYEHPRCMHVCMYVCYNRRTKVNIPLRNGTIFRVVKQNAIENSHTTVMPLLCHTKLTC
jgi:hypothetical protein